MNRERILLLVLLVSLTAAVPSHIPTWAYDEYNAQGGNVAVGDIRRYVTFAEGGLGNEKAVVDCRGSGACSSVWYFDPHLIYDSLQCPYQPDQRFMDAASEDWFVHFPGGSNLRVEGHYAKTCRGRSIDVPVYVANIANPAVQAFFRTYLNDYASVWDYYMMDDTGATLVNQMYGPGGGFCRGLNLNGWCTSTREFPTDGALVQAQSNFARAMVRSNGTPMQFFINGDPALLAASPRFTGVVDENAIVDAGRPRPTMYGTTLSEMAHVQATHGARFVLLDTGDAPAGSAAQIEQRVLTTAVVWLGFRAGQTVAWPDLEYNTNGLAVWPEDEIYPSQPLQSMRDSDGQIAVAPNVWRREFRDCYDAGHAIGPCAAVLNGTGQTITVQAGWLQQQYRHVIVPVGGDLVSGGFLANSEVFLPGRTTIPASDALLLVR